MTTNAIFCSQCGQPKAVGLAHNCFQAVLDELRARDADTKLQVAQLKYRVEKLESQIEESKL